MQGELSGFYLAEISDFTFHLALKSPYKIKETCTYSKYTHTHSHTTHTQSHTLTQLTITENEKNIETCT